MALSKTDIKVALMRAGVSQAAIARRVGRSVSHVSFVIAGQRRSPRVEQAVAEAIRRPVAEVFPPEAAA